MIAKKGYQYIFIIMTAVSLMMTGCQDVRKGTGETENQATEETSETQAVLEKVTYTSADGNISIILPDSNWNNVEDGNGSLKFSSESEGEILIEYADTKEKVNQFVKASTEKKLLKKLMNTGLYSTDTKISKLIFDKSEGIKTYYYIADYIYSKDKQDVLVRNIIATKNKGYQITGIGKKNDAFSLERLENSVKSVLMLKNVLSEDQSQSTENANSNQTDEENHTEQNASSETSVDEKERYFFSKEGETIYVKLDSDGNWVDKDGKKYLFYETWVEDENGTVYSYSSPEYHSNTADNQKESESYYDFYDKDGNYIKTTKDANGNWVDANGKSYIFREDGVTDSDGNFHPY